MKLERTKNATKNIIMGFIVKIYQIIVPFIMRTVMIHVMGVEYLGLNSLFTSILHVLNLAELGVGSAMVYSMYKPIAHNDTKQICALMNLYKKYYRIIGLIVLVSGIVVCPFVPKLIKSGVPADINVYILYLLNLSATVLSYWLFAYKNCLLMAHQRNDISSKVILAMNTIQYTLQFITLVIFKNYYFYVIILLLTQAMTNIVTSIVVDKKYPQYRAIGTLEEENIKNINNRVRDLFTSKIGGIIVGSADSIVISAFLGLTILAIYQNYYYIITAIIGIVGVIFTSCTAGIGNSIIVETEEKNYNDFIKFTFLIVWIAGFCSCSLLCLYQNFMIIWVGKKLLLSLSCVICFVLYFFVSEINSVLLLYKDAAGIWHKDRFRPLITALTNLALNLALVNFIGIYGVLLSTVISTALVGFPWLIHNLFTEIFKKNPKDYIIRLAKYISVVLILTIIIFIICYIMIKGNNMITLFVRGIICTTIFNLLFYLIFSKSKEMKETKKLVLNIAKQKKK